MCYFNIFGMLNGKRVDRMIIRQKPDKRENDKRRINKKSDVVESPEINYRETQKR